MSSTWRAVAAAYLGNYAISFGLNCCVMYSFVFHQSPSVSTLSSHLNKLFTTSTTNDLLAILTTSFHLLFSLALIVMTSITLASSSSSLEMCNASGTIITIGLIFQLTSTLTFAIDRYWKFVRMRDGLPHHRIWQLFFILPSTLITSILLLVFLNQGGRMRPGYTTWCFPVITIDRDTNSAYGDGLMLNLHSAAGIIMVLSVWIIIVLIHICYALVSGNVRWIMRQRGKVGDDDNNAEAPVGDSIISVVLDGDTTEFPQLQQQQQQQQQNKVHLVPPDPVTGSKEQLFRLCWAVMASVIFAWVPLAALLAIKLTNNSGEWLFEFVAVYLHSVDMMLAPVVLVRFHRGYRGFVYSTIVPESMRRLYILRLILGKEPT